MADFTLDELRPDISQDARDIICDLVLAWARLDSLVSQLVLLAFGLAVDGGTILLGSMDTKSKLDRLKKLYDHHGMPDAAQRIANLRMWHKEYVDIRNTVAHHTCAGSWTKDPNMLVFAPVRARQGVLNEVEIEHIPLGLMVEAIGFAKRAGDALQAMVVPLTERSAIPPPEPPAFLPRSPPIPQKNGGKGPPRPRKEPQG